MLIIPNSSFNFSLKLIGDIFNLAQLILLHRLKFLYSIFFFVEMENLLMILTKSSSWSKTDSHQQSKRDLHIQAWSICWIFEFATLILSFVSTKNMSISLVLTVLVSRRLVSRLLQNMISASFNYYSNNSPKVLEKYRELLYFWGIILRSSLPNLGEH